MLRSKVHHDGNQREGYYIGTLNAAKKGYNDVEKSIAAWLKKKQLESAVWINLPPRDQNGNPRAMTPEEAKAYINSLDMEKTEKKLGGMDRTTIPQVKEQKKDLPSLSDREQGSSSHLP